MKDIMSLRNILLAAVFGIAFNLTQRLLDHFIDLAVDHETWLAWLK